MADQAQATEANRRLYDDPGADPHYAEAAPHLLHGSLRALHDGLIAEIHRDAPRGEGPVRVLDLGAGEGTSAEAFLALGAAVTAVDISERQLAALQRRCARFGARLDVLKEDVWDALDRPASYDVVVVDSFLHHVPDYLGLLDKATRRLAPGGQIFTFQDPLRYDSVSRLTRAFSNGCYFAWRVTQGNLAAGLATRIRRLRGVYVPGSAADDAEYHVTRNGVDQDAIAALLEGKGFRVRTVRYFSTQSGPLQWLGTRAGIENTFGIVARRS